jgi:mono/diheme cytochrome c family protein
MDRPIPKPCPLIERGAYLARVADCVACHAVPGGAPFAGGHEMTTPIGAVYGTNITPDKATGIGDYSLADFDRALRHGVARDGRRLYPAMPYPSYAKLSDEDLRALYAYFMKGVAPAHQPNKAGTIPWPLNMRWPLALWSLAFSTDARFRPIPLMMPRGTGGLSGRGLGHCGACHTPRGLAMNEKALDSTGKRFLAGGVIDGWYAPSLRGDDNHGMSRWNEGEVVQFLKTGRNAHGVVFGSMSDAFNNSTQFMSDNDLKAIAHYLKSLPGKDDGKPWRYDAASTHALSAASRATMPAAQIYAARCSFCHGNDGRGKAPGSRRWPVSPRPPGPKAPRQSTSRSTDRRAWWPPAWSTAIGCPPIATSSPTSRSPMWSASSAATGAIRATRRKPPRSSAARQDTGGRPRPDRAAGTVIPR